MAKDVCVFLGEALARYGFGHGHPFGPDRMQVFWDEALRQGLDRRVSVHVPVQADAALIRRFHTAEYVAQVQAQSRTGRGFLDYGDTPAFPGVYEAAATVVGTTVAAVRAVMAGTCCRAFVPIAGLHHARRDGAAGFCVFNDCGVAVETLRAEFGVRRIAYVDIDAHHGDGVYYGFADDPELFIADIHEDGRTLYPGSGAIEETGTGAAAGTKLNLPMAPNADDGAFMRAWSLVEAFVRAARPEFVLLQCGADSIGGDPITHLHFTEHAHAHAAARLCALADEFCHGRLVGLGGGGYNRANLARAWCAVVAAMVAA